jgi:hypothetical protein
MLNILKFGKVAFDIMKYSDPRLALAMNIS